MALIDFARAQDQLALQPSYFSDTKLKFERTFLALHIVCDVRIGWTEFDIPWFVAFLLNQADVSLKEKLLPMNYS